MLRLSNAKGSRKNGQLAYQQWSCLLTACGRPPVHLAHPAQRWQSLWSHHRRYLSQHRNPGCGRRRSDRQGSSLTTHPRPHLRRHRRHHRPTKKKKVQLQNKKDEKKTSCHHSLPRRHHRRRRLKQQNWSWNWTPWRRGLSAWRLSRRHRWNRQ